jgi:hypothetical protein
MQQIGTRARDHLVLLGGDDRRRGGDQRRVPARVELVLQQPAHRKEPKLRRCQALHTVIGRHEHQALDRTLRRQANGDPASQAAAHHDHVGMRRMDLVEEHQRILLQRCLRGRPGTAAVTAIVHQEDRPVGKRRGQLGQAGGHILGVTAKVDQGLGTRLRPHRNLQLRTVHGQLHDRGSAAHARLRVREVDQRALKEEEHRAKHHVDERG